MAEVNVRFYCGCKFSTTDMLQAIIHVDNTGHSMFASGAISKDKNSKQKKARRESSAVRPMADKS